MTWKDEDIDKLFQEASKVKTFEFKEEYWEEMESMLPKKKKRKFPFIWIFSSIVITSSIAAVLLMNTDGPVQTSQSDRTSNGQTNDATSASTLNNSENKSPVNQTTDQVPNQSVPVPASETAKVNNTKTVNTTIDEHQNSTSKNFIHTLNTSNNNNSTIAKAELNIPTVTTPNPIVQLTQDQKIGRITLLSIPENTYEHTLQQSALKGVSPLYKWSMFFDFSTAMGQGAMITSSGSNFYTGFGVGTGINYSNGMWSLNLGINATLTSSRNLMVSDRQKIHGFGADIFNNNVTYKQLYQMEFPLLAGVKKNNQAFQFGLVPTIYIGAKILKESTNNNQTILSTSEYGYYAGTANFGLKPTIGYLYKLTPSIQIGGNIQMQLVNQTVQNYFNGSQRQLPLNGQLFIRKSLVIK